MEKILISDNLSDLINEIDDLEYDFEHYNHGSLRKNIKNILQSNLIQEIPMRSRLYLEYYQIFSVQFWDLCTVPDNITEIFNNFFAINPETISDPKFKLFYFCIKIKIMIFKYDFNGTYELLNNCQLLLTQLENIQEPDNEVKKFMGLFYYVSAQIHYFNNNSHSDQLNVITKCSTFWTVFDNEFYAYLAFALEWDFYNSNDNFDTRIDKINQCLTYFKQKDPSSILILLTMIVLTENFIFTDNFDLKKAQNINDRSIELLDGYNSERDFEIITYLKSRIYNSKGVLCELIGDFNTSLTNYLEVLECMNILKEKFDWGPDLSLYFGNIGELGDFEKALDFQIKSYKMHLKSSENPLAPYYNTAEQNLSESSYQLVQLYLQRNDEVNASKYIEALKLYSEKAILKNQFQPQVQYKLSQALLLIKKSNFRYISEAKILLNEVIKMPVKFELIADALIPLVEIVAKEYQTFQNADSLEEFYKLNTTMTMLVEHNNSVILRVNFMILQSKIAFIQGDFLHAEELYKKSIKIAEEFNQEKLINKINTELDYLINYLKNSTSEISIKERFEAMDIEKYINEVIKTFKLE